MEQEVNLKGKFQCKAREGQLTSFCDVRKLKAIQAMMD